MTEIKGIISPILTPMHDDESVNYEEFRVQINRMLMAGFMEYSFLEPMEKAIFFQKTKK